MSFTLLQQDNLKNFTLPLLLEPEKIVNFWNSLISLQFFQVLESLNTQQSKNRAIFDFGSHRSFICENIKD
jgi:hypothetical protein